MLDCHFSTQFPATPWIFHLDNKREGKGGGGPRVEVDFPSSASSASSTSTEETAAAAAGKVGKSSNSALDRQSFTVRRVIIYEKYVQHSNLINQGSIDNQAADVALLELDLPPGLSRSAHCSTTLSSRVPLEKSTTLPLLLLKDYVPLRSKRVMIS